MGAYNYKHTVYVKTWENGSKSFSINYGNGFLKLVVRNQETKKFESPENLLKEIFKADREFMNERYNTTLDTEIPNDIQWLVLMDDAASCSLGCNVCGQDPFDNILKDYAIIEDVEEFKKTFTILDITEQNKMRRRDVENVEYTIGGMLVA